MLMFDVGDCGQRVGSADQVRNDFVFCMDGVSGILFIDDGLLQARQVLFF